MKIYSFADVSFANAERDDFVKSFCGVDCSGDEVITKQSFAAECDVNNIMSKYESSGVVSFANRNEPRYGECSSIQLADALNTVIEAEDMFMSMPAKYRAKFDNDPVAFLAAVDDPSKHDMLRELGLMKPKETVLPAVGNTVSEADKGPAGPASVV